MDLSVMYVETKGYYVGMMLMLLPFSVMVTMVFNMMETPPLLLSMQTGAETLSNMVQVPTQTKLIMFSLCSMETPPLVFNVMETLLLVFNVMEMPPLSLSMETEAKQMTKWGKI